MNADKRRCIYTKTVLPFDFCLLTLGSAADKRRSQLKLNRGDAEEKKSLTAKDAKKRLIRIQLQERGDIATGGIRESFYVILPPSSFILHPSGNPHHVSPLRGQGISVDEMLTTFGLESRRFGCFW